MSYPTGSFVLLMDGCFWRFYEVGGQEHSWLMSRSKSLQVNVAKRTKRQSPMKPSWHKAERVFGGADFHHVPLKFVRAVYATEDDAVNAFDMLRSVHETHGPSGDAVLERLNLIVEMTRSDHPD